MENTKPLIYTGKEVDHLTRGSKSARHDRQNPKSPRFDPSWPQPVRLSARSVGYIPSEIDAWIASRPRVRNIPLTTKATNDVVAILHASITSNVKVAA